MNLRATKRVKSVELPIERRGGATILREKTESLGDAMRVFFASNPPAPKDFLKQRGDAPPQTRKLF